jgi:crotonobetainyl-CoA:carnitine CoA-transferase CaiB-like acyl-CoA transferase
MRAEDSMPLAGVKVLDLTQTLAGPFATRLLADLGCDVVKVESASYPDSTRAVPPFAEGVSHYFLSINHGKRSIELDLKRQDHCETLLKLAEKADVLISNFRVGVLDKCGLSTKVLFDRNPQLIQCYISGFGRETGEFQQKAAYDATIQAITGFMSLTADVDGPPFRCGVSIGDLVPALFAVQSITAALFARHKTGVGQVIDVPMYDCMFSLLTYYVTLTQMTAKPPTPSGAMHSSAVPMGRFKVKDGWIVIAAFTDRFWRNLCCSLDQKHWLSDSRFQSMSDRLQHRDDLIPLITKALSEKSQKEWIDILDRFDVPNAPVLDVQQVLSHPLVKARNLLKTQRTRGGESIAVSRHPVVFGESLPKHADAKTSPEIGAHSQEVLADWLN